MPAARQPRKVVAIDFGTSTTLVAVRPVNGIPEVIPIGNQSGVTLMPSTINIDDLTNVGESVPEHQRHRSVKSDLTRAELENVADSERTLAELRVSAIIKEAIRRAQTQVPGLLDDAEVFVGCPALWSGKNRKRLATIVHELGLAVDYGNVLDEPVAAGISWIRDQWLEGGAKPIGNVLVFDPGGGTLDIAYLRVTENKDAALPDISIYYADSIAKSGDYADSLLLDLLCDESPGLRDLKNEPALRDAVRSLKEQLSFRAEGQVNAGAPVNAVVRCDQSSLNSALKPLITGMRRLVVNVVKGTLLRRHGRLSPHEIRTNEKYEFASVLAPEINYVVLSGGLSRIPLFSHELKMMFPRAELITLSDPQEAVVRGLCYGQELVHLNLPRPPISFFARITPCDANGNETPEEICVYEAFSPIFRFEDAIAGNGNMYASWTCTAKERSKIDFFAVVPTIHENTPSSQRLVAFQSTVPDLVPPLERPGLRTRPSLDAEESQHRAKESSTFTNAQFLHDPRSATGSARIVIYPTAEILFQGATRSLAIRIDSWSPTPANFEIGDGIARARLWYQLAGQRSDGSTYNEGWRFN
jgi:hypothetical protein